MQQSPTPAPPSFRDLLRVFARIGVLSFGGPAGQIALMHRVLVDETRWLSERQYLSALNLCMLLPGPEAMQLATYAGWRLHGVRGGLAAGLLFVIPGSLVILALALAYAAFGALPLVSALFFGIKAAVLAIVVEALLRISRRALRSAGDWMLAAGAFLALFVFAVPFPLIVAAAALVGFLRAASAADRDAAQHAAPVSAPAPVPLAATLKTTALWLAIWLLPLLAVAAVFGPGHVLTSLAVFFSKLAVVTFGGAYAVLTYMTQEVVHGYGWLQAGEMLDALGLAETTPGPLILVTEFVGALAAWRHGGGPPVLMAMLGAAVTLWATFAPCFLWIFVAAPYLERITAAPRLSGALAAVTAAVVGVILNLTVWFAMHVLFARVGTYASGPVHISVPDLASLDPMALALAVVAAVMLFAWHRSVLTTLAVTAALGLALHFAGAV
jgi:chromate transporter